MSLLVLAYNGVEALRRAEKVEEFAVHSINGETRVQERGTRSSFGEIRNVLPHSFGFLHIFRAVLFMFLGYVTENSANKTASTNEQWFEFLAQKYFWFHSLGAKFGYYSRTEHLLGRNRVPNLPGAGSRRSRRLGKILQVVRAQSAQRIGGCVLLSVVSCCRPVYLATQPKSQMRSGDEHHFFYQVWI